MKKDKPTPDIAALAQQVLHHKRLYYAGRPEISDAEFDKLEDALRKLAPRHPVLSFVGSEPDAASKKVEHATPMLSLGKTYDEEELATWMGEHVVVGSYKIDGNSLSILYEDGGLRLAKTRGNGRVGEDVTDKAKWVADLNPGNLEASSFEVRGELYCTQTNFALLSKEMVAIGLEKPTSPRNIVAGLLGRKSKYSLASYFNFFAFDVIFPDGEQRFATEEEKNTWLSQAGFRLPSPQRLATFPAVKDYLAEVQAVMADGEIGLDGAVFAYNDTALHAELGSTAHHPRYKMSFKWQGETAVSTITDIRWETSRRGVVTPVAVIAPVVLSGASITNVTLHNAAHVRDYDIKPGDQIEVVRSGEVIPKFLRVHESAKGSHQLLTHCPSCGSELAFDDVRLRCENTANCPAQQSQGILNWIRCVEIDDLSEKRLASLIEADLVQKIPDLYRLTLSDFLSLPLTKEKMAQKLHANIQKSKDVSLARFLFGLGIEGAGLTSWEKLVGEVGDLQALRKASVETIAAVEGFAERSAALIVQGLADKAALIDELLTVGVKPRYEVTATSAGGALEGMQFVITGSLTRPRSQIEADIKQAGGKVSSSVSKNTNAVITNDTDSQSSKMKKARSLDIPIWDEGTLMSQIEG